MVPKSSKPPATGKSSSDEEILFDPNDFQSHEVQLSATNATRGVGAPASAQLSLVEFLKSGLVIDAPGSFFSVNDAVEMKIRLLVGDKTEQLFMVKGSVHQVETFENNVQGKLEIRDRVTVQLSSFDKNAWTALQRIYGDRQAAIEQFFKMVKD